MAPSVARMHNNDSAKAEFFVSMFIESGIVAMITEGKPLAGRLSRECIILLSIFEALGTTVPLACAPTFCATLEALRAIVVLLQPEVDLPLAEQVDLLDAVTTAPSTRGADALVAKVGAALMGDQLYESEAKKFFCMSASANKCSDAIQDGRMLLKEQDEHMDLTDDGGRRLAAMLASLLVWRLSVREGTLVSLEVSAQSIALSWFRKARSPSAQTSATKLHPTVAVQESVINSLRD